MIKILKIYLYTLLLFLPFFLWAHLAFGQTVTIQPISPWSFVGSTGTVQTILPTSTVIIRSNLLKDNNGNLYVTSTVGGSSGGGLSTSTGLGALVPGQVLFLYPNLSLAAGTSSIILTTTSQMTFFNVFGTVSSTEARHPSGTIAVFYFTNASGSNISASNIFDLSGNKFVTSTPFDTVYLSTSTPFSNNQIPFVLTPSTVQGTSSLTISSSATMFFFNVLGTVSSTEARHPSGTIATFTFTNASGSNITAQNIFDNLGNKFVTSTAPVGATGISTSTWLGSLVTGQMLFLGPNLSLAGGTSTITLSTTSQMAFLNVFGTVSSTESRSPSSSLDSLTFTNASGTNLFANGYLSIQAGVNIKPFQVASSSGRIHFQVMLNGAASSTEFYSPSSTITNLISTNVSGTNITAQNLFDNLGNKYVTSTSGGTGGGLATSSPWNNNALVFIATPNIVQASSSITVVTSTQLTSLYVYGNVSSTQLRSPSSSLDALTFVNASGTNLFANGYLSVLAGVAINPFQVASSSGRIHFQVLTSGVASSTEFITPSSTITTLTAVTVIATNVSSTNVSSTNLSIGTSSPPGNAFFGVGSSTQSLAVLSNGAVTIGTSTATGNTLLSVGTSTPALTVLNNGFIGIGTTTPSVALSITNPNISTSSFKVDVSTGNPNYLLNALSSSSKSMFSIQSSTLQIGSSSSTAPCLAVYFNSTSTLFYLGISTTSPSQFGYSVYFATSSAAAKCMGG